MKSKILISKYNYFNNLLKILQKNSGNKDEKNLKAHCFNNQKNIDGMRNLNMKKKNPKK